MIEASGAIAMGVGIFMCFALYFLPALIAGHRNHQNGNAITMLNLFLGWTALGWIIALVWSFTAVAPLQTMNFNEKR